MIFVFLKSVLLYLGLINNDITAFDSNCLAVIMYDVCLEGNC